MDGLIAIIGAMILATWFLFVLVDSANKEKLRKENEAKRRRIEVKRLALIAKLKPLWGDEICDLITAKKVEIGMSKEMVLLAWGKPHKVDNTEITERFEKTRWVYGQPRVNASYVTFKDGIVTSIKQTGST